MGDVEVSVDELVPVLRASHERLAAALSPLSDEQLSDGSYCRDWTVAQVASHLGSGAEIFGKFVDCGVTHEPATAVEFQHVWDAWNAKSPRAQTTDVVQADAALLGRVTAMSAAERQGWELDLFGARRDLAGVLSMRLAEHALHTWDVVVTFEPSATVTTAAVQIIIDNLAGLVERAGKPDDDLPPIRVRTSGPERLFLLNLDDAPARLRPATDDDVAKATLTLPAESFVRLIYGRLDADHTPHGIVADGVNLDTLRRAFPGF